MTPRKPRTKTTPTSDDGVPVGWVYRDDFLDHVTEDIHPDQPERLTVIRRALSEAGLLEQMMPLSFRWATHEDVALIHEPAYVDLVRIVCGDGFTFVGDRDTQICEQSYQVALLAVGGVMAACDAVIHEDVRRAFCAVRPPGHHAERDQAMGFCLFNNVAIAAEHLVRRHGVERVAIVDFDVHHGNGTQHAFEERSDVLYISLHERSGTLPFPGSGEDDEIGRGQGRGFTLNAPIVAASGDAAYREALAEKVIPALDTFRPEFLLISAGFDAVVSEWVAHMCLESSSYGWMTRELVAAAERHAKGRVVSVLEGGYDLAHLGASVTAHVEALVGR